MHNNEFNRFFRGLVAVGDKILPALFWLSVIYSLDEPFIATLTIIAALIHEMGHILVTTVFLRRSISLRGVLSGFRLSAGCTYSYGEEILLYAAGPLANILAALPCLPFLSTEYIAFFFWINLATALSNLLPLEGYDGYGILRATLLLTPHGEERLFILDRLSLAAVCTLSLLSLYLIDRCGEGYWIFFMFFTSLVKKLSFSGS